MPNKLTTAVSKSLALWLTLSLALPNPTGVYPEQASRVLRQAQDERLARRRTLRPQNAGMEEGSAANRELAHALTTAHPEQAVHPSTQAQDERRVEGPAAGLEEGRRWQVGRGRFLLWASAALLGIGIVAKAVYDRAGAAQPPAPASSEGRFILPGRPLPVIRFSIPETVADRFKGSWAVLYLQDGENWISSGHPAAVQVEGGEAPFAIVASLPENPRFRIALFKSGSSLPRFLNWDPHVAVAVYGAQAVFEYQGARFDGGFAESEDGKGFIPVRQDAGLEEGIDPAKVRILVVDDESQNIELISEILIMALSEKLEVGQVMVLAATLAEANEWLSQRGVDEHLVVFTDLNIPAGLQGLEIAKAVRELVRQGKAASARVVLVSSPFPDQTEAVVAETGEGKALDEVIPKGSIVAPVMAAAKRHILDRLVQQPPAGAGLEEAEKEVRRRQARVSALNSFLDHHFRGFRQGETPLASQFLKALHDSSESSDLKAYMRDFRDLAYVCLGFDTAPPGVDWKLSPSVFQFSEEISSWLSKKLEDIEWNKRALANFLALKQMLEQMLEDVTPKGLPKPEKLDAGESGDFEGRLFEVLQPAMAEPQEGRSHSAGMEEVDSEVKELLRALFTRREAEGQAEVLAQDLTGRGLSQFQRRQLFAFLFALRGYRHPEVPNLFYLLLTRPKSRAVARTMVDEVVSDSDGLLLGPIGPLLLEIPDDAARNRAIEELAELAREIGRQFPSNQDKENGIRALKDYLTDLHVFDISLARWFLPQLKKDPRDIWIHQLLSEHYARWAQRYVHRASGAPLQPYYAAYSILASMELIKSGSLILFNGRSGENPAEVMAKAQRTFQSLDRDYGFLSRDLDDLVSHLEGEEKKEILELQIRLEESRLGIFNLFDKAPVNGTQKESQLVQERVRSLREEVAHLDQRLLQLLGLPSAGMEEMPEEEIRRQLKVLRVREQLYALEEKIREPAGTIAVQAEMLLNFAAIGKLTEDRLKDSMGIIAEKTEAIEAIVKPAQVKPDLLGRIVAHHINGSVSPVRAGVELYQNQPTADVEKVKVWIRLIQGGIFKLQGFFHELKKGKWESDEALVQMGKDTLDMSMGRGSPGAPPSSAGLEEGEEFNTAGEFLDKKEAVLKEARKWDEAQLLRGAGQVVVVPGVPLESSAEKQELVAAYFDDTLDKESRSLADETGKWKAGSREPEKEFLIFLNYPTHAPDGKVEIPAILVRLAGSKQLPDPSPKIPVFILDSLEQLSSLKPSVLYSAAFNEALKGKVLGPLVGVITYQEQGQTRHALIFA